MWNLPPPPGFQGLHPHKPLIMYRRNLPHWRQDGASYFVTCRLADSLPRNKLDELIQIKREREEGYAAPNSTAFPSRENCAMNDESVREIQERSERWLDQGMGRCLLKDPAHAVLLIGAMHHFDGDRYELGCYVVMANHVHAIVRPLKPDRFPLEELLGSWKKFSSRRINELLNEKRELWQEESYDRIIRDEEHLWRVIQYIGSNPRRSGTEADASPLWIRPEWVELGWRFDDSNGSFGDYYNVW